MKIKKLIAALSASVLLGGMIAMPVSAEEAPKYEMGDVDMDGEVTMLDAQLALEDFLMFCVMGGPHTLTDEQLALADVTDIPAHGDGGRITNGVTGIDAQFILMLATLRMMGYDDATFENMDDYAQYLG